MKLNDAELRKFRTGFEIGRNFYEDNNSAPVDDSMLESDGVVAGVCMTAHRSASIEYVIYSTRRRHLCGNAINATPR